MYSREDDCHIVYESTEVLPKDTSDVQQDKFKNIEMNRKTPASKFVHHKFGKRLPQKRKVVENSSVPFAKIQSNRFSVECKFKKPGTELVNWCPKGTCSTGVQTVESDLGCASDSVKLRKTSTVVQPSESNSVAHNFNLHEPPSENDNECCIVFDGCKISGGTERGRRHVTESSGAHDSPSEVGKIDLISEKPKTYEEAMLIVKAFEKKVVSCDNLDMEEVILDFEPPRLHEVCFYRSKWLSRDDKKNLISQGIPIRSGRWSKSEDKILLRNWNNFVEKYHIDNPAFLLGLYRGGGTSKEKQHINAYRRIKKFNLQLGKDLNDRTLESICKRAKNLFDRWNYQGRFSAEERKELFRLQRLLGNHWAKIAIIMNKRGGTCTNVYRRYKGKHSEGAWSEEEDNLLFKSIKRYVGGKKLRTQFRGYPWARIARLVPNRNESQCREHWLTSLCWKYSHKEHFKWKKKDDALLIYVMYADMVEDQCFVDWDSLRETFGNLVPSYVFLQHQWTRLKRKVPGFADKDHESIVLYLYKNYLPKILQNLNMSEHDLKCMRKEESKKHN